MGKFNLHFASKYIYPLGRALTVEGRAAKLAEWQTDSLPAMFAGKQRKDGSSGST
ncbi:hypothetical protein [Amycolatopsis coloradensis]|uniref:hypothetical protein n=1 Tax=Amycolatopsis coloradensis TaxID=76021 RepID=UPI00130139F9|nr:hypothetical protein [Amycolatopsis coloradensis]